MALSLVAHVVTAETRRSRRLNDVLVTLAIKRLEKRRNALKSSWIGF
jgi:hypothetical protein